MDIVNGQQSLPRRRDLEKCHQCRKNKQKCQPTERDWTNAKEKCKRCSLMGYECGPSEPTMRKARLKDPVSDRSPRPGLCVPAILPNLREGSGEDRKIQNTGCTSMAVVLTGNRDSEIRSVLGIPSCTEDASPRGVMDQVAVCLAVQRLLLCCQRNMQSLDRKTGFLGHRDSDCPYSTIQSSLHCILDVIMSDARLQLTSLDPARLASLDASTRKPEETKLQLWRYKETTQQWQKWLTSTNCTKLLLEEQMEQSITECTPYEFDVLSCTEHVLVGRKDSEPTSNLLALGKQERQAYENAATKIRLFMKKLGGLLVAVKRTSHDVGSDYTRASNVLQNAFPAPHIAFWNHDKVVANSLWKETRASAHLPDLFGRSYAHIVTEAGDLETLRYIGQHSTNSEAIWNAGEDAHGRTLLHVAAALGNRDVFTIIIERCADTSRKSMPTDAKLLELAVRGGSPAIVRRLLRDHMVEAPFTSALERAIELGITDIADSLLTHMEKVKHSDEDLQRLAKFAAKHNQHVMEHKLRMMTHPPAIMPHWINYSDYLNTSDWTTVEKVRSWPDIMFDVPNPMRRTNTEWSELTADHYFTPYSSLSKISAPGDGPEFSCSDFEFSGLLPNPTQKDMVMSQEPLSITHDSHYHCALRSSRESLLLGEPSWS